MPRKVWVKDESQIKKKKKGKRKPTQFGRTDVGEAFKGIGFPL